MPGMGGMGGMGGGGRRRREERPELIPSGTPVTIRGLQGAAQHNNKRGKVVEHDAASGRYTVLLDDGISPYISPISPLYLPIQVHGAPGRRREPTHQA